MKKIIFAFLMVSLLTTNAPKAFAAACDNSANYGSVILSANIPESGEYVLWTRMKVPDASNNTFQLEIAGNTCLQIGGGGIAAGQWNWVKKQSNNSDAKYTFPSAGSFGIKLIGSKTGVEVDKILFLGSSEICSDNSSTPTGTGDNCATEPVVQGGGDAGGSTGGGTETPPVTETPASGAVTPEIVSSSTQPIEKVEYYVDNKLVQSNSNGSGLDTTLLNNGDHKLTTKVTYSDGTSKSITQDISVDNPENFMTPVIRWSRNNKPLIITILALVSSMALGSVIIWSLRALRRRRLFMQTHGLLNK